MNHPNQYLSPQPDVPAKPIDGIDMRLEQSSSLIQSSVSHHQQFQISKAKFSSTGLWRKKRDIASIKINHSR